MKSVDSKEKNRVRVETLHVKDNERVVIVGDIHGCLSELEALLRAVPFREGQDHLVVVGDIVNKGPDSIGAARLLQRLGAKGVQGNHDAKLLKLAKKFRKKGKLDGKHASSSLGALAATLPSDVERYLSSLPHVLRIPFHQLIVVHAGLHPEHPLESQSVEDVLEMRNLVRTDAGLVASAEMAEGVAWASLWPGPETVCFGHNASRGLQRHPHALGIDTNCCRGGALTAVVFPGRALVSVPGWTGGSKV